jgi:hypothetical protein
MSRFCDYSELFGKVGEGWHSYRIFNIAIVDVLAVLVAAFILKYLFGGSYLVYLILLFIVGILVHRLFCVRTTIDKLLF